MLRRNPWVWLVVRVLVVTLVAALLIALPDTWLPDTDSIVRYKNAIVVLVSVVTSGKFLYDTLFYERLPM